MATNELDAGGPVVARERLALAAGAALLVAGVVLVTAVLPAEFGSIHGSARLGLTAMGLEGTSKLKPRRRCRSIDRRASRAGIPAGDDRG
jgi:hypothetical protein